MGENSIFDDLGIGLSDLGIVEDPKKLRAEAANKIQSEKDRISAAERTAESEFAQKEEEARVASGSRSRTILSGDSGLLGEDDEDGATVSRRTLLGS